MYSNNLNSPIVTQNDSRPVASYLFNSGNFPLLAQRIANRTGVPRVFPVPTADLFLNCARAAVTPGECAQCVLNSGGTYCDVNRVCPMSTAPQSMFQCTATPTYGTCYDCVLRHGGSPSDASYICSGNY